VVVDHVGGEVFERSFKCLALGRSHRALRRDLGADGGDPLRAVFFKSLSILGSTMGSNAELGGLLPFFERGRMRPVVAATMPLAELPAAHEQLAARESSARSS
jgi:NADPH:quinone reductase-like Zn-dependent oxidoreductase